MDSKIGQINFAKMNKMQPIEGSISINASDTKVGNFKDVVIDMINEMNKTTNKPQELLADAMQGKADIHDVMAAVAKSELTVQAAATVTGKILQTYEKIMQITI